MSADGGLRFELLMQLFFLIEGLSLWKVPAPTAKTVTDFNDEEEAVCEKILSGDASPSERTRRSNEFLKVSKAYKLWRGLARAMCSFWPVVVGAVLVLCLSLFWNVEHGWRLWGLNFLVFIYWCAKITVIGVATSSSRKYDQALRDFSPVTKVENDEKFERVES